MTMAAQMPENPLKEKLARGDLVASMIVRISRGPEIGRIAATAGLDALYVDLEHSVLSLETTALICTAAREAGVVPLVRVPQIDASLICRVLDGGAMGIVVPHVESAEDARHAVACALYPPQGRRSAASGQAILHYRNFPQGEANAAINASMFLAVMIESRAAIECIDEIAAVQGVNMLFIGAGDLSVDMGLAGQPTHPDVGKAIARVLSAAARHGVAVGLGGLAGEQALLAHWVAQGARFISTATDLAFLSRAAADSVRFVKGLGAVDIA
ncbi:HpcH/HpaI aldolase family protein [Polaromonas sp.]|uniref:HpcH/HpaI aldolase family protein n=1 Tax=Polaromonas sp. TaxID=1869339 RepID=UPI003BAB92A3